MLKLFLHKQHFAIYKTYVEEMETLKEYGYSVLWTFLNKVFIHHIIFFVSYFFLWIKLTLTDNTKFNIFYLLQNKVTNAFSSMKQRMWQETKGSQQVMKS